MSETNNQIKFQEMLSALKNEIRETGLKLEGEDELTVEVVVQELQAQLEMKSSKLTRLMRLNTIVSPEVGFQSVPSDALPAPITVDQFTVVPVGLPLFQWKGQVKDEKHEVFADIEECLGRFEDVLRQHTLDFNLHWYRLLPPCLPSELREWLTKYIKVYEGSVAWSTLRTAITARYGVPKEQLQFERIREFLKCKKTASESIDDLEDQGGRTEQDHSGNGFFRRVYQGHCSSARVDQALAAAPVFPVSPVSPMVTPSVPVVSAAFVSAQRAGEKYTKIVAAFDFGHNDS
ncbi:hypothetical protein MBANPS3_000646 [Mucor bainieri]